MSRSEGGGCDKRCIVSRISGNGRRPSSLKSGRNIRRAPRSIWRITANDPNRYRTMVSAALSKSASVAVATRSLPRVSPESSANKSPTWGRCAWPSFGTGLSAAWRQRIRGEGGGFFFDLLFIFRRQAAIPWIFPGQSPAAPSCSRGRMRSAGGQKEEGGANSEKGPGRANSAGSGCRSSGCSCVATAGRGRDAIERRLVIES